MILEKLFPARHLPHVSGWYFRVLLINAIQLAIVLFGLYTWEKWLSGHSLLKLGSLVSSPFISGTLAYLVNTWIMYWWHYARHQIPFLWRWLHQIHHSAARIEVITSFYKHPLEILLDAWIMALLAYPVLGLSKEASVYMSVYSALGEYVYHMNLKTPRWFGWIFQRPESHCLHHQRYRRVTTPNYGDIPLWDILNNTFENPDTSTKEVETGYKESDEVRLGEMLMGHEVYLQSEDQGSWTFSDVCQWLIILLGFVSSWGFIVQSPTVKQVGFLSTASPLPLVFSAYQGMETFATTFDLTVVYPDGSFRQEKLTRELYAQLKGPYNRRNIYGVLFSYGPFFEDPRLLKLRDHGFHYAFCHGGPLAQDFELGDHVQSVTINIKTKTKGKEEFSKNIIVNC